MDTGDIPAWIALAFSSFSLISQFKSNKHQKESETLRSKLARLEKIEKLIAEIRTTASIYWLHPEAMVAKEGLMLTHLLKELAGEVSRNSNLLWLTAKIDVMNLKMLMTGSDFQNADRPGRPASDHLIKGFSKLCTSFSEKLNAETSKYRN